uniref:Zgc:152948 n=1 Tax=Astyanax mexicanus TaxID=7994 RepID=W5KRN2_ASTMX
MGSVDGLLSPESTVTSLLASSGRLKSSLNPEPVHTIRYKDRNYESASEALDAYIADFQQNLQISKPFVGHLELSKGPATAVLHHSGYRNRDVLKESLTEKELDFLNLPVRPKHRGSDRLSMTTDDLLLLPSDGSLPVTRTSAFLSQSESYSLGHSTNSSSWSRSRHGDTPQSSRTHRQRTAVSNPHRERASGRERSQCVDELLLSSSRITPRKLPPTKTDPPGSLPSQHLPRWITSHKSEMNFSGVTSIPDLKYPIWLRECDVPIQTVSDTPAVPCWVSELEKNSDKGQQDPKDQLKGQGGGSSDQTTLRELRLQFTETLGAAESRGAVYDSGELFRGDRIGSLIKRAEQVLTSPSLGLGGRTQDLHGSPGGTEELLEAEHSWENPPVTFKSPVPVGDAEEQLTVDESLRDTAEKSIGSSSGYSSRKHHGPVEALKQMLFSLQAVEQRVTQHEENGSKSISSVTAPNLDQMEDQELKELPQPDNEDHDSAPGGQSLQRALHHLGRLKSLVDEMNEKKARELQPRGNEGQS